MFNLFKNIDSLFKNIDAYDNKKSIIEKNEFIKNNRDKLEKIINNNSKMRKLYLLKFIIAFCLLILISSISVYFLLNTNYSIAIIGWISDIVVIFFLSMNDRKYKKEFKENVIREVIHNYNSSLKYFPNKGISRKEYDSCCFPESYNIYNSEDLIVDSTTSFEYADVLVKSEYEDSEGRTHVVTRYKGSLAKIDINDCECNIFFGDVKKIFFVNLVEKIKFENDEFNDMFNVHSNNELMAYKLLTPDIMEKFVDLKKNIFSNLDIRILKDKLYVRFLSGDGFVPSLCSKRKEMNSIISSIAIIETVFNTLNSVKKIIDDKKNK